MLVDYNMLLLYRLTSSNSLNQITTKQTILESIKEIHY